MLMVKHAYIDLMFSEYFKIQDKQGAKGHEFINILLFQNLSKFTYYL